MINLEVRPSPIAGRGVFALRDFAAGEIIGDVPIVREITAAAPLLAAESADHCRYIEGRAFLIGAPACFVNHCCEPNAYHLDGDDGWLVAALTDVRAGDEITYDYVINTHGGSSWPCACGARACRGATAGSFFDLPIALQRRYAPYLAPWFVRAHRDAVGALHD